MSSSAQLIRAHLNMLLLAVLQRVALHGYAIREALRLGSDGRFELSEGSVYPALRRLEHIGLVASSWSVADGRHIRTYRLTAAGRDKLRADRRAWEEFANTITALLVEPQAQPISPGPSDAAR